MHISKVALAEMLEARERRSLIQHELISKFHKPLVCLTMNIAGPVKRTPLVRLLFDFGLAKFEALKIPYVTKQVIDAATGCEAFYSVDSDPALLKAAVCGIEESFPSARLFDFDVIDTNGEKLSRTSSRTCIVCGGAVQVCARSRAHGLEAIESATDALLCDFAADGYAKIATKALLREVHTTPKPGLVDENNNGAHRDMDISLFEASANALTPYFRQAVLHGLNMGNMPTLRETGLMAEEAMFAVTNGINTHKGAIFSFGLLLSAIGTALRTGCDIYEQVTALLASEDRTPVRLPSHGDAVREQYGGIGAANEAEKGFPSARFAAERLAFYRARSAPNPEALVLCELMATVEDTNLYHRGGEEGVAYVRAEAQRLNTLPIEQRLNELFRLDEVMIRKNLSPGGCADLLALSLLIDRWNRDSKGLFPA